VKVILPADCNATATFSVIRHIIKVMLAVMQDALFPDDEPPATEPEKTTARPRVAKADDQPKGLRVRPQPPEPAHIELAAALPPLARLGTSSWTYPGWTGLVWDADYSDAQLSRHGLAAYAQHPLFRAVSLDRAFYRPLSAMQYAAYASQVGGDFRFTVKAPALVTDATVRSETGRAVQPNPAFLNAELAVQEFVRPALQGLGPNLGALVFEISPLPRHLLADMPELLKRLSDMLQALPSLQEQAPGAVVALEVRDPQWLTPAFAAVLRAAGATYCMGLHAKMPPIEGQLPMLRALWPGPLVCRWNLHRVHGAYGYEDAAKLYLPYNRLVDEDPETRVTLARVINATAQAGHHAYVTLSNKAEGCAPLSVAALAREIVTPRGQLP
jgi:uncharacterized protein YecE (DUF72 family)